VVHGERRGGKLIDVLKKVEYRLLKEFNDSLSDDEKELVKTFLKGIPEPMLRSNEQRRKVNMMTISFIEGVRYGRNHPAKKERAQANMD
jgi:adenine C2-methylase RlmN of 23S rRNA A2503 and tRNA A37